MAEDASPYDLNNDPIKSKKWVLVKDPCGSKVLERYVLESYSEVKAGKEQSDHEMIIWDYSLHGLVTTAFNSYWGSQKIKSSQCEIKLLLILMLWRSWWWISHLWRWCHPRLTIGFGALYQSHDDQRLWAIWWPAPPSATAPDQGSSHTNPPPTSGSTSAPHSARLFRAGRISFDLEVFSTTPVLLALVKDNLGMVL